MRVLEGVKVFSKTYLLEKPWQVDVSTEFRGQKDVNGYFRLWHGRKSNTVTKAKKHFGNIRLFDNIRLFVRGFCLPNLQMFTRHDGKRTYLCSPELGFPRQKDVMLRIRLSALAFPHVEIHLSHTSLCLGYLSPVSSSKQWQKAFSYLFIIKIQIRKN